MFCATIQEFAFSLPTDSGLLRTSVVAGEPIDQAEVLSLTAMAQSLFVTITIESHALDRVSDCFSLWTEASELFNALRDSWVNVDSDDPQVKWLRGRLAHYAELCQDRRLLYRVSESDRVAFSSCRESEMRAEAPEVPQDFTPREVAHINAACQRLGV